MANRHVTSAGAGAHDGTTLANAYSFAEFITAINIATGGGDDWYLYGAFSRTTTTDTISVNAPINNPHVIHGCASTPGDGFSGYNAYGFLVSTNFAAITYTTGRLAISGDYVEPRHLKVVGATSGNSVAGHGGFQGRYYQCHLENTFSSGSTSSAVSISDTGARCVDCDIFQTGSGGTNPAVGLSYGAQTYLDSCRIRSVNGPGVGSTANFAMVQLTNCVIYDCGTDGVLMSSTAVGGRLRASHCTFYANAGAGIKLATGFVSEAIVEACAFIDNGTYGVDQNSTTSYVMLDQNYYDGNGTAALNVSARTAAMETRAVTTAGPLLQDEANFDLRPYYGSPLLPATVRGVGIGALWPVMSAPGGGFHGYGSA